MNTIKTSLAVGTSTLMLLANTGVVFGADLKISKTGANSVNLVSVSNKTVTSVVQSNKSNVVNSVSVVQNTGDNSASKNTGKGMVVSGNAAAMVLIANGGSSNELTHHGDDCGCVEAPSSSVSNTGYKSVNKVSVSTLNLKSTIQSNISNRLNKVGVLQNTGDNDADKNTGSGVVVSGDTDVVVELLNEADSNTH